MRFIGELIGWGIAAGIVSLAIYVGHCVLRPYARCRWCEHGVKASKSGRSWRDCRHCRGSGKRIRLGRRLWTKLGIAKNKMVG